MPRTRAMGLAPNGRTPLPTRPRPKTTATGGSASTPGAAPQTAPPNFSQGAAGADTALATTVPSPGPLQGPAGTSPAFRPRLGRRGTAKRRVEDSPEPPSSPPRKQRRVASKSADTSASPSPSSSARPSTKLTLQAASDTLPGTHIADQETPTGGLGVPDATTKADVGSASLSHITTPSASVFSKEHTSTRGSPNTSHGSQLGAEKTGDSAKTKHDLVEELRNQFSQFPTGEIAYGCPIQPRALPQVRIKDVGVFNLPFDSYQLAEIRKYAYQRYAGKFGVDWPFNSAHRLTSTIPAESFEIVNSKEWNAEVAQLVTNVGLYLGFGQLSADIKFKPGSLYVWDQGDIWRGYGRTTSKEDKDKWIGTIVLVLQQECKGGEIAARYRSKDMLLDPGMRGSFLIANHSDTLIDVLPLTEGYRFAMTYELFLSDNPLKNSFLDKLVDQSQSSQWELLRGLKTWVSRIQQGNMENFPLIHVLEGEYEQKDMYISSLNAADRSVAMAAIRATRDERLTPHDGYTLSAYLVIVKATSKNYSARSRVRYSIEWAITLFGALVPDIKALLVNETGVLQTDRFQDGQTTSRQVTKTMHTTTKTVACLVYVWENGKKQ